MDSLLPSDIASGLSAGEARSSRTKSSYRVVVGNASHPVLELRQDGFVIAVDGRPPLRGYADVFQGDDRVLRGLVTCAWAEDGRVGYDFKRSTGGHNVPADYVLPAHSGLLE